MFVSDIKLNSMLNDMLNLNWVTHRLSMCSNCTNSQHLIDFDKKMCNAAEWFYQTKLWNISNFVDNKETLYKV